MPQRQHIYTHYNIKYIRLMWERIYCQNKSENVDVITGLQ